MSPEFLKSDTWVAVLDTLLMRLEQMGPIQCELDSLYEQMTSEIILEMGKYINYKDMAKPIRKRYKIIKHTGLTTSHWLGRQCQRQRGSFANIDMKRQKKKHYMI